MNFYFMVYIKVIYFFANEIQVGVWWEYSLAIAFQCLTISAESFNNQVHGSRE